MPYRALRLVCCCLALLVSGCDQVGDGSAEAASSSGVTRTYYIAADDVIWDYAPSGMNLIAGRPFTDDEAMFMEAGPKVIGRRVKKAIYREYTDDTFQTLKPRTPEWEHLGYLGPLIRAEVGDTIHIVFKNNAGFPASMHPHGVFYDKSSEGALYDDGTSGALKSDDGVPTGETHTYVWEVPERAGPLEHGGSSALWMYHSHVDEVRDVATGLFGPIIVTKRGMARSDASPIDVDREIVAGFMEIDENQSWYLEENIKTYATEPESVDVIMGAFHLIWAYTRPLSYDKYFRETINGYSYGNTPGLTMKQGERVRWYLLAGTGFEIHSVHWHGNVPVSHDMRTDVVQVMTMGMVIADMIPDNPGKWLFHCHVGFHLKMGMEAHYMVEPADRV